MDFSGFKLAPMDFSGMDFSGMKFDFSGLNLSNPPASTPPKLPTQPTLPKLPTRPTSSAEDSYCDGNSDCKLIHVLYKNINSDLVNQNKKLSDQVKKTSEIHSTDYQKSNYQNANMMSYKFANNILFWSYWVLVLIVAYVVFNSGTTRAIKAIIIGLFIAYPFIITNIEILLYELLRYLYALLSNTVYTTPEF